MQGYAARKGKRYLIIATVLLLGNGFRGIMDAARFHHVVTISYAQFLAQRPTAGWFRIPDARLDLEHAILPADAMTDAYYVPVVSTDAPDPAQTPDASASAIPASGDAAGGADSSAGSTQLVAYVTDNTTVRDIDALHSSTNLPETVWGMQNASKLPAVSAATVPDGVSGMIMPSLGNNDQDSRKVDDTFGDGSGAMIGIHANTQPAFLFAMLQLVAGAFCALGTLWAFGINPSVSGTKEMVNSLRPQSKTVYRPSPSYINAGSGMNNGQNTPSATLGSSPTLHPTSEASLPPWAVRKTDGE